MKAIEFNSVPKTAFVLFNNGAFGGAEKRFSGLFCYLNAKYPGKFYFFINNHLLGQINRIFGDFPINNIRIVDLNIPDPPTINAYNSDPQHNNSVSEPRIFKDIIPDPLEVDRKAGFARKIYWFQKNKMRQRKLYNIIERYRQELGIEVFMGIFSGVLPLVFYLDQNPRSAAVIFSDMDSWFSDVQADMKTLWYRKYYSFNYALENSDIVDFLSPYIIEGVKKRNIRLNKERISITACSAVDYSKCRLGSKEKFEIAFCGRLEPDKNPLLYLEAAHEILKQYPLVKFHILGEGSLVNEVNGYLDSNKLRDKINFQFHKNPPEVFAQTSVFVSLQTGTNYPSLSVIESMACGNAIIASNTGDTGLLVNVNNGLLVDLTLNSIVSAMRNLIDNPQKTNRLGSNAREFVMKEHTLEKESDYYMNLFINAKRFVIGEKN